MNLRRRRFLSGLAGASLGASWGCTFQSTAPAAVESIDPLWFPLADGKRLAGRLWRPVGLGPVPVVLEYIPYRARDVYRAHDDFWGPQLAQAGLAYLRLDVRGSGDSDGLLTDEYTDEELNDGVAVIEQLAQLPWCSGQVGLRGISWGAINALLLAAKQPPAVRGVLAFAGTDDRSRDDAHFLGGLVSSANLNWGLSFKVFAAAPPDPSIVGEGWLASWRQRLTNAPPVLARWLDRRARIPEWHARRLRPERISVPTLLVAGWQDTYAAPMVRIARAMGDRAQLWLGAWGHTYPSFAAPNGVDWLPQELNFWRSCFQHAKEPRERRDRVFIAAAVPRAVLPDPLPGGWFHAPPQWREASAAAKPLSSRSSPTLRLRKPRAPVGTHRPEWLEVLPGPEPRAESHWLPLSRPADESVLLGIPRLRLRLRTTAVPAAIRCALVVSDSTRGPARLLADATTELGFGLESGRWTSVTSDRWFEQPLELSPVNYRPSAGQRLWLVLSWPPWPLLLPLPGAPELEVDLKGSSIALPWVVAGALVPAEVDAVSQPAAEPEPLSPVLPEADGAFRYERAVPLTITTVAATATRLSARRRGSARWWPDGRFAYEGEHERRFERADWRCRVTASYSVRVEAPDAVELVVRERVSGYFGDDRIGGQDHETRVRR
ncbi:MAG: CocE/NonD family hydrolase [Pseudomonadota bacterium]